MVDVMRDKDYYRVLGLSDNATRVDRYKHGSSKRHCAVSFLQPEMSSFAILIDELFMVLYQKKRVQE